MKITTTFALRFQFMVLMAYCSTHVSICSSYGNETDTLSLLDFKQAISLDPQGALVSWNGSTSFCDWEGVSCRLKNPRRVISLNLTSRGLVGHISPSLGNLTFLRNLFLDNNKFSGQIPPILGQLHHLQSLYITRNKMQGSVPDFSNCSNLAMMILYNNELSGRVPGYASLPPRLVALHLAFNNFTGLIPSSLANITTLNELVIEYTQIEGNVPYEFGKLSKLQIIGLGVNKLSGPFQPVILNLSSLTDLTLAFNRLNGVIPSNIGTALPNLRRLELDNNFFDGHMPSSLANASKLFFIDISTNNFTGVVPRSIGNLDKLTMLNLESNKFQAREAQDWDFMRSLSNCSDLQAFSLYDNQLEGEITSLANLSVHLQYLYLGRNKLSGVFPSGIVNFRSLVGLGLNENQLTGELPEWLGTLQYLQGILISNNMFTGFVPSSISNLSQLTELYLDSNQFEGYIPQKLGNLQILVAFNISHNSLSGSIPMDIFSIPTLVYCGLSSNNLDGPLPFEIGSAKQLLYLELSSNKLSGYIPKTLSNCDSMEEIAMDQNFLNGSIPVSLGNISSLKVLNLSHNRLSGSIPRSFSSLEHLQILDLSFNQLEGKVPSNGIFKNATVLRINGNKGLCGGIVDLKLLMCSVRSSGIHKNIRLSTPLKVVIPLVSMVSLALIIFFMFWRSKSKNISVAVTSFGRKFPKVSYSDLHQATEGFSATNLIGRGQYGSVYRGELFQDGNVVAIKVFSLDARGAHRSFIAECDALRTLRHRNVVPILTACSTIDFNGNDFKALVYEFMTGGDLHKLLYSTEDNENLSYISHLTLAQRLSIVVDVANALDYLHHNNEETIVHCDLKPSNILLDENMVAHVGDFGLAKFKVDSGLSSSGDPNSTSVAVKGTIGYVAPEYATSGETSTCGDVYSFGVVLLEIFIRKKPTDDMFKDGLCIVKFVENNIPDAILQIVDLELMQELNPHGEAASMITEENSLQCLLSVLSVGLSCTRQSSSERISMQQAAAKLNAIWEQYIKVNRSRTVRR